MYPICSRSEREVEENLHKTEHSYSLHTCTHIEEDTDESEEPGTGGEEEGCGLSGAM